MPLVSRTLNVDLSADDAQRRALAAALRTNDVDERAARILTKRLDLEQAAREAAGEA